MNIILVGHRACGRSRIAKILANQLWKQLVDAGENDVDRASGDALPKLLAGDDQVIALADDVVTDDGRSETIRGAPNCVRIYLMCTAEVLAERSARDDPPGEAPDAIAASLDRTAPLYERIADHVFDVTHLGPTDAVRYLVKQCL
ncbi:MAG: hypothetical protein CMJ18_12965 [Phycisphaeraceae bacterium]|nr:hypothetical protein [Phycisphaeraceae bacterium]